MPGERSDKAGQNFFFLKIIFSKFSAPAKDGRLEGLRYK